MKYTDQETDDLRAENK